MDGSSASPELSALRTLTPAPRGLAEAKRIDRDYSNRNGFDAKFVPGLDIDLAKIIAPVKSKAASLLEPSDGGAPGELAYENFSVVMHRVHRIAIVTATNIDGKTYVAIDRTTGEPAAFRPAATTEPSTTATTIPSDRSRVRPSSTMPPATHTARFTATRASRRHAPRDAPRAARRSAPRGSAFPSS